MSLETSPKSNKKYQIILADPPWSYNDKMEDRENFSVIGKYETQSLDWIKALKVPADDDCVLFLWAVSPLLPEAFDVITAWGFKYKTVAFCWIKESNGLFSNTVKNLGRWTMGGMELCLLGTKGKPQRISKNVCQLVFEQRERHSQKPKEVHRRIVNLMGDIPRIELFARQKTDSWDVWSNEIESDIELVTPINQPKGGER